MIIQICVGSSCHIKGSAEIVAMFQKAVEEYKLDAEVTLAGSFCTGQCNRYGVTVQIEDEIYTGLKVEDFKEFFREKVLAVVGK